MVVQYVCLSILDIVKSFIVTVYFEFVRQRLTHYNSSTFSLIPKIRCVPLAYPNFLDEATNSLDANNERSIVENLDKFYKGKTVVIVAHRLSTVKNADQIVVIDHGKVVEIGNHESLTAKRGAYYNLVKNQLELGN